MALTTISICVAAAAAGIRCSSARREADVQGKPGLQLWRSDKNVTGYVGVTLKDKKSAEPYSAKGPIVDGEGQYLGRFRTALEAATAFAQHVQGMGDEWQQSRQLQNAWLEPHPGAEEGIKKGKDSKAPRRAEMEAMQSGGREGSHAAGHGGSTPTVRLLQSKSGADEYKGVLPTVTRAAGLDLHLSAKTNTGYEGVSMKKEKKSRNEHGNRQNKFYVTCKGTHVGCFPSAVEAAAAEEVGPVERGDGVAEPREREDEGAAAGGGVDVRRVLVLQVGAELDEEEGGGQQHLEAEHPHDELGRRAVDALVRALERREAGGVRRERRLRQSGIARRRGGAPRSAQSGPNRPRRARPRRAAPAAS